MWLRNPSGHGRGRHCRESWTQNIVILKTHLVEGQMYTKSVNATSPHIDVVGRMGYLFMSLSFERGSELQSLSSTAQLIVRN
ncbi:hypothetical protein TNCV_179841 [Trichonephila clavipes]|nr:hypothetical protein TNCV_179841 [Trichonephila clavipes]